MKSFPVAKILSLIAIAALCMNLAGFTLRADEHETELGNKMKVIGKSMKQLKSQISDATKQQSTIDLLEAAKKAASEAKLLTPDKAKDLPEADRPKFITDFQTEMDKLIDGIGKTEEAVKAGKYDDATKLYGDLGDIKREGHKQFQADKD